MERVANGFVFVSRPTTQLTGPSSVTKTRKPGLLAQRPVRTAQLSFLKRWLQPLIQLFPTHVMTPSRRRSSLIQLLVPFLAAGWRPARASSLDSAHLQTFRMLSTFVQRLAESAPTTVRTLLKVPLRTKGVLSVHARGSPTTQTTDARFIASLMTKPTLSVRRLVVTALLNKQMQLWLLTRIINYISQIYIQ